MASVPSLLEALGAIADPRSRQGRRHPLVALLALACAATLCGAESYSAIAEWGRNYDQELVRSLGFTHAPPCAATFWLAFGRLERAQVEAVLGAWAEAVLATLPPRSVSTAEQALEAVALDGKTLRGSRKQGAPGAHLLSALSQRLGLTLGQVSVDDKTNELGAAPELLRGLVLEGRVVTMDALLTQRAIARTLVDADAHYVMLAKGNQPQLEADITAAFRAPPPAAKRRGAARRRRTAATGAWSGVP